MATTAEYWILMPEVYKDIDKITLFCDMLNRPFLSSL